LNNTEGVKSRSAKQSGLVRSAEIKGFRQMPAAYFCFRIKMKYYRNHTFNSGVPPI